LNRIKAIYLSGLAALVVAAGCAAPTFVKTSDPAWATISIRDDLDFDHAWSDVLDTLTKKFDMEILQQSDGYARTAWSHTWTGKRTRNYRVRVTVEFAPDHKSVEVKSEAESGGPGKWVKGYDSRLLETIKAEVERKVGRSTGQAKTPRISQYYLCKINPPLS
jgi:hypothetical protein